MNKTQKISIIIFCLFIIGVGIFAFVSKVGTPISILKNPTKSIPVPVSPLITENNQAQYYTVDMTYPQSSDTKYPEISAFINKNKQDFLTDANSITPEDANTMNLGGDRKYNFNVTTKVATSTNTVTYIVEVYTFTGGAHGGTTVGTFTYDSAGKYVTLDGVFTSPYLTKISNLARTFFYDTIDKGYFQKESVDSGTEPTIDNYSAWYLTDKTVTFIFGQYQVGPYVLGIQEFPLDKTQVADIISPEFK